MSNFIKIERYERDCPHNTKLRAKGEPGIIYDFHVFINGEHRADLIKNGYSRGYDLREPHEEGGYSEPIREPGHQDAWRKPTVRIESQGIALYQLGLLADKGVIPTLAQIEEGRKARAKKRQEEAKEARRANKRQHIVMAAHRLHRALRAVLRVTDGSGIHCAEFEQAKALIEELR